MIRKPPPQYSLFDLELYAWREQDGEAQFTANLLNSAAGTARVQSTLKLSQAELDEIAAIAAAVGLDDQKRQLVDRFGEKLFDAVLAHSVGQLYRASLQAARSEGKNLRVRLRFETPEAERIPWEFLYDRQLRVFLGRSAQTALSRYVEIAARPPIAAKPPLQILYAWAGPKDLPRLGVIQERDQIDAVFRPLEADKLLQMHFLPNTTLANLREQLLRFDYHVVHFVGHGVAGSGPGEFLLAMEDKAGNADPVSSSQLREVFRNAQSLGLVVLNACLTTTIARDLCSGAGVPAAISMQYPIADQSSLIFSERLYSLLATGWPVDAAVAEARNEIGINAPRRVDWATPTLHMRVEDGRIFDLDLAALPAETTPAPVAITPMAGYRPLRLKVAPTADGSAYEIGLGGVPAENALKSHWVSLEEMRNWNDQVINEFHGRWYVPATAQLEIGRYLFSVLFAGGRDQALYDLYGQLGMDEGLRLQLELAKDTYIWRTPWELLHGGDELGYLATAAGTLLSRYVPVRIRRRLAQFEPPLRLLVVFSEPPGVDVQCKQEEQDLWDTLRPYREKGLIEVDIEWNPTPYRFQQLIGRNRYHIVQFSGVDSRSAGFGEGIVLVEDLKPRFVEVDEFCTVFRNQNTARLVFLNTCLSVEALAPALVRAGVPSVVAMQFGFDAKAAARFPRYFYPTLMDDLSRFPIDLAVAGVRTAFFIDQEHFGRDRYDWLNPVLVTSIADGNYLRAEG